MRVVHARWLIHANRMPVSKRGDKDSQSTVTEEESEFTATKKQDAHRALELLEEYHSRLVREEDQQLRRAIEQVIRIFKSCLFQALLEIQAFYEVTLQDDDKSLREKTVETLHVASKWEERYASLKALEGQIFTSNDEALFSKGLSSSSSKGLSCSSKALSSSSSKGLSSCSKGLPSSSSCSSKSPALEVVPAAAQSSSSSPLDVQIHCRRHKSTDHLEPFVCSPPPPPPPIQPTITDESSLHDPTTDKSNEDEFWRFMEIMLERGITGFGFSITGGKDHTTGYPSISVTKVIENKAAAIDGRLRVEDILVSVNGISTIDASHHTAVELLRKAGNKVHLIVKRRSVPRHRTLLMELKKGPNGLGFSICGGMGNQHIPGDNGIFVKDIVSGGVADIDGRLRNDDCLLEVNSFSLEAVTHSEAVAAIKATGDTVRLLVAKTSCSTTVNSMESFSNPSTSISSALCQVAPIGRDDSIEEVLSTTPTTPRQTSSTHMDSVSITSNCNVSICPLPPMSSLDPNLARAPRRVVLKRSLSGLGFNIVGGEDGKGIFISYVLEGGAADRNGDLRKGDQILSVNGVNFCGAPHEMAAGTLKTSGDVVDMTVVYKPEDYNLFELKIQELRQQLMRGGGGGGGDVGNIKMTPKKTLYVRALFDYDPSKESDLPGRGLSFHYGDVLHVTNASDEEWWQAARLVPCSDNAYGLIPSKTRVERKEKSRVRNVKFSKMEAEGKEKSQTFPREIKKTLFSRKLSWSKIKEKNDIIDMQAGVSSENVCEDVVLSYEPVVRHELQYQRPLIIFGPLKDQLNDDLISEFPERFGTCVPHTTRTRRKGEADGREYHFVTSREEMERDIVNNLFIEAGQYNGNLYGTSLRSVIEVAEKGMHCILDVSAKAIQNLQAANLFPIAILIKPTSPQNIIDWNRRTSEEEARRFYEQSVKLEQEFGDYFTAIISGCSADDIYASVKDVTFDQSDRVIWLSVASSQKKNLA